ncbi:MAG: hypothetical protein HY559_04685 [Gammaproteobacteria bacterium]|nr:hypothetical protein [Gammaproteobacteria bacterium]
MRRLIKGLFIFLFLSPMSFAMTPFAENEIIAASEHIFSGKVIAANPRINKQGNLIVTDYTFEVDKTLWGKPKERITLTFAGGRMGKAMTMISEVPIFEVGQQVLLMVEDMKEPLLSPTFGVQGEYTAAALETEEGVQMGAVNGGNAVIMNAEGKVTPFSQFVNEWAEKVARVKQDTALMQQLQLAREVSPASDVSLNSKKYDSTKKKECEKDYVIRIAEAGGETDSIADSIALPAEVAEPPLPSALKPIANPIIQMGPPSAVEVKPMSKFVDWISGIKYFLKMRLPITFIPLPRSDPYFQGADGEALGNWNVFLKPEAQFRVRRGELQYTWGMGNGCNEIAGFVDEDTFKKYSGFAYGMMMQHASAVTVIQNLFNIYRKGLEIDIVFNSKGFRAGTKTENYLADKFNYRTMSAIHWTIMHEVGHSLLGQVHLFKDPAVMNYIDPEYGTLFAKDIAVLHENYGGEAAPYLNHSVYDVGIRNFQTYNEKRMFYTTSLLGKPNPYSTKEDPYQVKRGETIEVRGFYIENLTPQKIGYTGGVEWYLCPPGQVVSSCQLIERTHAGGKSGRIDIEAYGLMLLSAALKIPQKLPLNNWYDLFVYVGRGDDFTGNNGAWLQYYQEKGKIPLGPVHLYIK